MELLVTGAWQDAKVHIEELEKGGHQVHFLQYEKDELPCSASHIEGVICNGLFLYHDISDFLMLRYIQLTSAGYDRIPIEYVKKKNIEIHNAGGVYSIPMAEFTIAGVLNLYKKMMNLRENQKIHKWEKQRNLLELYGKTVVIFGCGNVGSECAKRFAAFGAKVIGVKRVTIKENQTDEYTEKGFSEILGEKDSIMAIAQGDIIISALPLTKATYHFFNKEMIFAMKQNAVFVNISRGGVVDTEALEDALKYNKISGAVLDVFEEEPLEDTSIFWNLENVIVTPHNSFVGEGNQERLWNLIKTNLQRRNGC